MSNSTKMTLVGEVLAVSRRIKNCRTNYSVHAKITEENGELAQEVRIAEGDCYKEAGNDGILGEAIDIIASAIDIIYINHPDITEEELIKVMLAKLAKWEDKEEEIKQNKMAVFTAL